MNKNIIQFFVLVVNISFSQHDVQKFQGNAAMTRPAIESFTHFTGKEGMICTTVGKDDSWSPRVKDRLSLYRSMVTDASDDNCILPPWWKTRWAYFLYSMVLVMLIIFVDRIQTERVISNERKRTMVRELEHAREIEQANKELHAQNVIVKKQKHELEINKMITDELLLNILPSEIAEELKVKGFADAKLIDEVTVLFADFKGFTQFSEKLSPQDLVREMHECFSAFDHIMQKHGVEKIKTIGDSYMAAGGLPTPNNTHATDVVSAAFEMQQFIFEHKVKRESAGKPVLELRIGVHTGPVVAGIVGVKKFAYDIWGDTVNTASHVEKSGDVGRVNISGATYHLVKHAYNCTYRGKIEAKNKGMIDMYFVNCE